MAEQLTKLHPELIDLDLLQDAIEGLLNFSSIQESFQTSIDAHSQQLIDIAYELDLLAGRESTNSNFLIENFTSDTKTNADDSTTELQKDTDLSNNWKVVDNRIDFQPGYIRNQQQKYKLDTIQKFDIANISGYYKHSISRYDETNDCYWMVVSHETSVSSGSILKLHSTMKDGIVTVTSRWHLRDLQDIDTPMSANAFYSGIDVDFSGEFLFLTITNNSGSEDEAGLGKLSINSDGTLGKNNVAIEGIITWQEIWDDTGDFHVCNELTTRANDRYAPDCTVWDENHVAVFISEGGTKSIIFKETADDGAGEFTTSNPRDNVDNFEVYLGTTDQSSIGIYKYLNDLWIKINTASGQKEIIYVDVAEVPYVGTISSDTETYTGDITGYLNSSGANPEIYKTGNHFDTTGGTDSRGSGILSKEGITVNPRGNMLEVVSDSDGSAGGAYLVERDLSASILAENQIVSIIAGPTAWDAPTGCMVDSSGNLWTTETGLTNTNQIHRWELDGTITSVEFGNSSPNIVNIFDITTDDTNVYILAEESGGDEKIYKAPLTTLVAALGGIPIDANSGWSIYTIDNSKDFTAVCFGYDIEDNPKLFLTNGTDDTVWQMGTDGSAPSLVYDLPTPGVSWTGIAFSQQKLFVKDGTEVFQMDMYNSNTSTYWQGHVYQFSNCDKCIDFDNNGDLVGIQSTNDTFTIIATLENPDVLQLHSFIDGNNILLDSNVGVATPIAQRFFDPEDFTETIKHNLFLEQATGYAGPTDFNATNDVSEIATCQLTTGDIVFAYKSANTYGYFAIYEPDGTQLVAPTLFNGSFATDHIDVIALADGSVIGYEDGGFVIAYVDSVSQDGEYLFFDADGTPTVDVSGGGSEDRSGISVFVAGAGAVIGTKMELLNNGDFVIAWDSGSNAVFANFSSEGTGGVSSVITASPGSVAGSDLGLTVLQNDDIAIAYRDGNNSNIATYKTYIFSTLVVRNELTITGASEETSIAVDSAVLANYVDDYITIHIGATDHDFWFDTTGSASAPGGVGANPHEVDISGISDEDDIAALLATAINAVSGFTCSDTETPILVVHDAIGTTTSVDDSNSSELTGAVEVTGYTEAGTVHSMNTLGDGNFIVSYRYDSDTKGRFSIFNEAGDDLQEGPVLFNDATTSVIDSTVLENGQIMFVYENTSGTDAWYKSYNELGDTVQIGPIKFSDDSNVMSITGMYGNSFVIGYRDISATDGLFVIPFDWNDVASRRNCPDENYMAVGYGAGAGSMTILNLDTFLNKRSDSYLPRYDVNEIRVQHFKHGANNVFEASERVSAMWIEKDLIICGTSAGDVQSIDLRNGQVKKIDQAAGPIYNGTLSEANAGVGYASTPDVDDLDIGSHTSIGKIYARTFINSDESDYISERAKTFVTIGGTVGVDLLIIDWSADGTRNYSRVYKNLFNDANTGDFAHWIAPSGYVFAGESDSTGTGQMWQGSNLAWEVNSENHFSGGNGSALQIGALLPKGDVYDIAPNSRCWKNPTGEWRHQLVIAVLDKSATANYEGAIQIIDVENAIMQKVYSVNAADAGFLQVDTFEDYIFGQWYSSVCGSTRFFKQGYFNDLKDTATENNWMSNSMNLTSIPYFNLFATVSGSSHICRYSPQFGILTVGTSITGIQMYHMRNQIDESVHTSVTYDIDESYSYAKYNKSAIVSGSWIEWSDKI